MVDLLQIIAGTTTKFLNDINENFLRLNSSKQDNLTTEQKRKIYYGTTEPSQDFGQDGDIYIQIEG